MADKRQLRFKISAMPWRPGLLTAGQATTMPELDMRKCTNADADLDGMIRMRPALDQWGQTIKEPNAGVSGATLQVFTDFINGLAGLTETDSSSGNITTSTTFGELKTTAASGTPGDLYTLGYETTLSANATWSLRFMFRGSNLQAYDNTTTADTFLVRAQGSADTGKEFAIWAGGLYYRQASDSKFVLISGSELIGTGGWHSVEIQCDSTANTLVYMNDTLLATLTSSDLDTATFTGTAPAYELEWEVDGDGEQYSTYVTTPMYNDVSSSPFSAKTIKALSDFQYLGASSTKIRSWVMAAGNYIYHDKNLNGAWRPLKTKQYSHIYFAPYRTYIAWTDNNGASTSAVWLWDGKNAPELQNTAPPIRYLVEHQKRLCGWGDIANPRRLYYSGDRLPNVWFSPSPTNTEDQFSEALDAGYVEIESFGREVKAVVGDYHGQAIVVAERGFWKMSGYGVFSYKLDGLKIGAGAANAESAIQVGNDVWFGGPHGISSVLATDQFGDVQAAYPSVPIQDLFTATESSDDTINQTFIHTMRMIYSASRSSVYIAVPHIHNQTAQQVYIHNRNTQKFYGPLEIDATALAVGELASPVIEVVMMGGATGQVAYLNPFVHRDYRADAGRYTMTVQTAALNGRSLDPKLIGLEKTWKTFRLFFLPRTKEDYTVSWWTDMDPNTHTFDYSQNTAGKTGFSVLDLDFLLDKKYDSILHSGSEMAVEEIDINVHGRDCTIQIDSSYNMAIQGWELEGIATGYESDD